MDVEAFYRSMPGLSKSQAHHYVERWNEMLLEAGATTAQRVRYLTAQVGHESVDLKYREEIASGAAYEGRCRDLGNCQPGDGRRFKGRDWIQITGRHNYGALSRATGVDFVGHPTWLSDDIQHAGKGVVWYWAKARNCNAYCDHGDFVGLTRAINGGTNGLADRQRRLRHVQRLDGRKLLPTKPDPLVVLTEGERRMIERLAHERKRAAKEGWGSLANPKSPKAKATYWKRRHTAQLAILRGLGATGKNADVRNRGKRYWLVKRSRQNKLDL